MAKQKVSQMIIDPFGESILYEDKRLAAILKDLNIQPSIGVDMLLRFIVLVYEPGSPLIHKYPDIRERKEEARAQLKFTGKENHALTIQILKRVIKKRDWTLICSFENAFDEFTDRVNEELTSDDDEGLIKAVERKAKLLEHMERFCAKVKDLKKVFYCEDDELEASDEEDDLSPEGIALRMGLR